MTDDPKKLWPLWLAGAVSGLLLVATPYISAHLSGGSHPAHKASPPEFQQEAVPATAQVEKLSLERQSAFEVMPGDVVELTGTGLDGPVAVTVGYKFVSHSAVAGGPLSFIAPELAEGEYDVAVSRGDGQKAVLTKLLIYGGEAAVSADVGELELEPGVDAAVTIQNRTERSLVLALIRQPAGYTVEMPSPRELAPGQSVAVGVRAGENAKPDYLVLQGGSTRLSISLAPAPVFPKVEGD